MRKIAIFFPVAAVLLAAGCNTISGAGKDVSSVGKAVSRTADKTR